jgi:tetratricopeptide (TPR) repeat protein
MCIHPNTPDYEQAVTALADLTRTIAQGQATAVTWLDRGEWLQLMGEMPGAIRDYDRALARHPELTRDQLGLLYLRRGVAYRRLYDFDRAEADLLEAVQLKPDEAYFWTSLGIARYYKGDIEQALADLIRANELSPTEERAWEIRPLCLQALGRHEEALAAFDRRLALAIAPAPLLLAQRAYSCLVLGRLAEAIADCDRGDQLDAHGSTFETFRIRGRARYQLGDAAAALGDFSQAIAMNRELVELYLWRGLVYRSLGDPAAAADDITEYVKRHPQGAAQALKDFAALSADAAPLAVNWPAHAYSE